MSLYGHTVCFMNCHLPAHMENLEQRLDDFERILELQQFEGETIPSILDHEWATTFFAPRTGRRGCSLDLKTSAVLWPTYCVRLLGIPVTAIGRSSRSRWRLNCSGFFRYGTKFPKGGVLMYWCGKGGTYPQISYTQFQVSANKSWASLSEKTSETYKGHMWLSLVAASLIMAKKVEKHYLLFQRETVIF